VWAVVCVICAVPFALELTDGASCAVSLESAAKCLCYLCCSLVLELIFCAICAVSFVCGTIVYAICVVCGPTVCATCAVPLVLELSVCAIMSCHLCLRQLIVLSVPCHLCLRLHVYADPGPQQESTTIILLSLLHVVLLRGV
jgi:hypothetical protein